jgi:uncharacterized protein YjiS (DUF1127 family)
MSVFGGKADITQSHQIVRGMYLRNATRTLQQFDDHILADIGLRRE